MSKEKTIKEFGEQKAFYVEGDPWSCLTKREYFAGLAMQGMLANSSYEIIGLSEEQIAKASIEHADNLIEQLTN